MNDNPDNAERTHWRTKKGTEALESQELQELEVIERAKVLES